MKRQEMDLILLLVQHAAKTNNMFTPPSGDKLHLLTENLTPRLSFSVNVSLYGDTLHTDRFDLPDHSVDVDDHPRIAAASPN